MPAKMLERWSKDSNKTIEEVEKIWNSCKVQAKKSSIRKMNIFGLG